MQEIVATTGGPWPVILMIETANEGERSSIRQWFEDSRFVVLDGTDIFSAIEEMSDFTMRGCPEVVLLNLDASASDLTMLRGVIDAEMGHGVPIMMLSNRGREHAGCFTGDLTAIANRLEHLIPRSLSTYH